jgi:Tfp pilus assembly protein PilP
MQHHEWLDADVVARRERSDDLAQWAAELRERAARAVADSRSLLEYFEAKRYSARSIEARRNRRMDG